MVNVLMLEELHELVGSKGRVTVNVNLAWGLYCVIRSCSLWDMDRADLEATLNRNGYLLNRSQMRRYSLPL